MKNALAPRIGLALALAGVALTGPGAATRAEAQIQLTPDSGRYLIQRFVPPNEQWAITYNFEDRTLTGNVFKTDGGEPSFIWCQFTDIVYAPNPADNQYTLDCWGSDACTASPCDESAWVPIGTGIPLPASFVLPPGTTATFEGNVQPIFTQTCALAGCHDGNTASEGLNLTPGVAYDNLVEVPARQMMDQSRVEPFDADASYLYAKLLGNGIGSRMPLGGMLSEEQTATVRNWILEGAVRN